MVYPRQHDGSRSTQGGVIISEWIKSAREPEESKHPVEFIISAGLTFFEVKRLAKKLGGRLRTGKECAEELIEHIRDQSRKEE